MKNRTNNKALTKLQIREVRYVYDENAETYWFDTWVQIARRNLLKSAQRDLGLDYSKSTDHTNVGKDVGGDSE